MGISERKEREREARRTTILDAAENVFKEKGFALATMDDIARFAELAKGTVYLYYKSKEELQVGLVIRGMDMLADAFSSALITKNMAIEKIRSLGAAYWSFAEDHLYYFTLMHIADLPFREGQISQETVQLLHDRSSSVWTFLVSIIEQAKLEGTVKSEVNSLAVAMMLWMNSTAVLRFHHKVRATPNNLWSEKEGSFNMCEMDWRSIYGLNANLLLHEVVTEAGLKYLDPVEWPHSLRSPTTACAPPAIESMNGLQFRFEPFSFEELPLNLQVPVL